MWDRPAPKEGLPDQLKRDEEWDHAQHLAQVAWLPFISDFNRALELDDISTKPFQHIGRGGHPVFVKRPWIPPLNKHDACPATVQTKPITKLPRLMFELKQNVAYRERTRQVSDSWLVMFHNTLNNCIVSEACCSLNRLSSLKPSMPTCLKKKA
jgi:hypothetical protein